MISDQPPAASNQAAQNFALMRLRQLVQAGLLGGLPQHMSDPAQVWRGLSASLAQNPQALRAFLNVAHPGSQGSYANSVPRPQAPPPLVGGHVPPRPEAPPPMVLGHDFPQPQAPPPLVGNGNDLPPAAHPAVAAILQAIAAHGNPFGQR